MVEVRDYIDSRGHIPYRDWITTLDASPRARVIAAVPRLELGNFSAVKSVGLGVSELLIDFGPGFRIYFGKEGERLVILLGGEIKKRQQADIHSAAETSDVVSYAIGYVIQYFGCPVS